MSTLRQKKLAREIPKAIAEGKILTGGELVARAGYGEDMQRKPGEVLNSPGVQEELKRIGFTEEKAKEVVAVILGDETLKPEPRLKAAEMVFKTFGTFAPDKQVNVNIDATASEKVQEAAKLLNELHRGGS